MRKMILFTLSLFPLLLNAQCIVDAGEDQNICSYLDSFPKLNGQIVQADSIVNLKWEAISQDDNVFFFASDMLSDTTVLNPELHTHYKPSVQFFLTATDISGQTCTDSVTYRFSDWVFLAVDKAAIKGALDTISLWPAGGSNFPIVKYEWSPDYNISDVNDPTPEVWNDTTTTYDLLMTDSIGCTTLDDPFEVFIRTTSSRTLFEEKQIMIYPNPVKQSIRLPSYDQWSTLIISDQYGRQLSRLTPQPIIPLEKLSKGVYYLTIVDRQGKHFTKKIIKQ